MPEQLSPPAVGKLVTIVAVSQGEPLVTHGKVLLSKENLVAVQIHTDKKGLRRYEKVPVTVIYGDQDYSLVLRGRVMELVKPDRLVISTPDAPRVGERREFIRTDLDLGVRVEAAPPRVDSAESLREWVGELPQDVGAFSFREVTVDLSGSGARFVYPEKFGKGDFVAVSFELPEAAAQPLVHLPASIVRARPAKNLDAAFEVAVTFVKPTEEESDLVNHVVFESRARRLGVAAVHVTDEE